MDINYDEILDELKYIKKIELKKNLPSLITNSYYDFFSIEKELVKELAKNIEEHIDDVIENFFITNKEGFYKNIDFYINYLKEEDGKIITFKSEKLKYIIFTKNSSEPIELIENGNDELFDDIFEVKKVGLIKKFDKFNIKNKNIVDILANNPIILPHLSDYKYLVNFVRLTGVEENKIKMHRDLNDINYVKKAYKTSSFKNTELFIEDIMKKNIICNVDKLEEINKKWLSKISNGNGRIFLHGVSFAIREFDNDNICIEIKKQLEKNPFKMNDKMYLCYKILTEILIANDIDLSIEDISSTLEAKMSEKIFNKLMNNIVERAGKNNEFLLRLFSSVSTVLNKKNNKKIKNAVLANRENFSKLYSSLQEMVIERKEIILNDKNILRLKENYDLSAVYLFLFEKNKKEEIIEVENVKKIKISCKNIEFDYSEGEELINSINENLNNLSITPIVNKNGVITDFIFYMTLEDTVNNNKIISIATKITKEIYNLINIEYNTSSFIDKKEYIKWENEIRELNLKSKIIEKENPILQKKKI